HAIPDGKPLHTFPGIASLSRNSRRKTAAHFSWNCFSFTQFQTENRCTLFLELLLFHAIPDGKPLHTFPGIASLSCNSRRKTAAHFSWNCFKELAACAAGSQLITRHACACG
ncbi:MAG: hypothetical protein E5W25_25940, partial [Mesorhizobium sp.]